MAPREVTEVGHTLLHWRDFRLKLFVEGIVIGLIAGFIVVMFRFALEASELLREGIYRQIAGNFGLTAAWFLVLFIIACLLGLIMRFEPMSGGSGIPQAKGVLLGLMEMNWLKVLVAKFIGGVLAIGAGMSLGREGPSIQIGSVVGQGVSRILDRTRMEERYLLTSGASAGLAAAFNAPLAGVIFALEEMHKNFSPAVLMASIAASLTADFVARCFSGGAPFWNFVGVPILPFQYYGYLLMLGVITGISGIIFNKMLMIHLDIYARQRLLPDGLKALFPLFVAGLLGFVLPEVLGGGNNLITTISADEYGAMMLLILLIAKFFHTMISYGSGVPGGIFLPMLVIGALTGAVFSEIMQNLGFSPDYHTTFIILAMAAYFTAVVKAPITGSILITEMTGSFSHLLELMVISMIAYLVADIARSKPIYDALLEKSLMKQKQLPAQESAIMRTVSETVVCVGSKLDGQKIMDVAWPHSCLLVCIRRGDQEIVPRGDTKLFAGDHLYVSINDSHVAELKFLAEECNCK